MLCFRFDICVDSYFAISDVNKSIMMKDENTKDWQGEVNRNREHRLKSLLYFTGKYDILMENRDLIVYCQERKHLQCKHIIENNDWAEEQQKEMRWAQGVCERCNLFCLGYECLAIRTLATLFVLPLLLLLFIFITLFFFLPITNFISHH